MGIDIIIIIMKITLRAYNTGSYESLVQAERQGGVYFIGMSEVTPQEALGYITGAQGALRLVDSGLLMSVEVDVTIHKDRMESPGGRFSGDLNTVGVFIATLCQK